MTLPTTLALLLVSACGGQSTVTSGARGKGPENTVPASVLAADSCNDAVLVTLESLATGVGHGTRIALDVVPEVNRVCTLLDCGDNECCNRCRGEYGATLRREPADRDLEVRFTGLAGCSGMDCNFQCEPFGRQPTTRYRIVGVAAFEAAGTRSIAHAANVAVEKVCLL